MANRYTFISITKLAAALVFICTLHACEQTPKQSAEKDTITKLVPGGNERIFGPAWDSGEKMMMFLPLIGQNDVPCTKDTIRGLAESIKYSDDYRFWTIRLKKNIKWHDGVPVTAHDIKFTIDLWKHPDVVYYAGSSMGEVTVLDDYNFTVKYDKPNTSLNSMWDVYYPKHLLKDLPPKDFLKWAFWEKPVGNGSYRYERDIPGTMIELSANPDFFLGAPKIERFILKFGADGGAGMNELKSGSVDMVENISVMEAFDVMNDDRFVKQWDTSPTQVQLDWNHTNPLFADKRIRRALTHAIDRRTLHKTLMLPDDLPLTDSPYTACQYGAKNFSPALEFDQLLAAKYLEEAGWTLNKGQEVRGKEGKLFEFTLLVSDKRDAQAAVFIQAQLKMIGVQMDILPLSMGVLRERHRDGKFDAAIFHMGPSIEYHHAKRFGADNLLGFNNETIINTYIENINNGSNYEEWGKAYENMASIFLDEIPATFLYPPAKLMLYNKRIKIKDGAKIWPAYRPYELWIEE